MIGIKIEAVCVFSVVDKTPGPEIVKHNSRLETASTEIAVIN